MSSFNDQIIEEFRANGGHVETAGFGDKLILLHTRGARTGEDRVAPTMALRDEDSWLIYASKAGAPEHPAWYFNLLEHPEITIETPHGLVEVTAHELKGDDRDTAWRQIVAVAPGFGDYEAKAAPRVIPVFRLTPR
ncbi:nitroreductase/quinone reductase family protein [Agreia sp. VKM Ac-1783]|uniref:nitroreductase/quinone reductase family protein n=1 Tax=Agreia sp. VKM Ac-1783 TaxID=1938889 RepID=UPI000A2AEAE0|nr:nitroreductase/quinone reductase family protein [Agreia sp. VKM Ac-1783]SMQ71188.1 deazaflavin-dependent oxidoreductase, nitroreductase family [Agreia sp. VKM Ac-1783]